MYRWSDKRRTVPHQDAGDRSLADRSSRADVEVFVWRESSSAVIQWQHPLDPGTTDIPSDAVWFVERSSSPFGPWHSVHQDLPTATRKVRDDHVHQGRTETRYIFYRVRWISASESSTQTYGSSPQWEDQSQPGGVTWDFNGVPAHLAPGAVREMRSRFITLLRLRTSEPCLVYRPSWLSPYDHKVVNPRTGTYQGDWGSGASSLAQPFAGGYDHPFEIQIDGGGAGISVQLRSGRITDMKESYTAEIPYWPPIQIDDILRFMDGELAQVASFQPSMMHDHVISFSANLSQIERGHPINKLPMPAGFREKALFARRVSSRAMNLDSYQTSLERGSMRRASILPPSLAPAAGGEDL